MSDHGLRVIARVRPLSSSELAKKESSVISISGTSLAVRLGGQGPPMRIGAYAQSRSYRLDCVLDERSTQNDVFSEIEPLLQASLDGYNTTVFTYGQSGTGKTFSMLGYDLWAMAKESLRKVTGASNSKSSRFLLHSAVLELATDPESIGIIPRSMEWLFIQTNELKVKGFNIRISVSYLEIHNEKLIDLLNTTEQSLSPVKGGFMTPNISSRQLLEIREVSGDILVAGLTLIEVQSAAEVLEILWMGAKARSIAATDMNEYSSRSHTIFQAYVELTNIGTMESFRSKISLVDLAGSEKLRVHQMTNFTPERIRELTSINKSLSSLSNCISALLQKSKVHIPYRDSKLTRLLQDSLGGNTKSAFVVTLSPSATSFEETISTLQFADRVMKVSIETRPNRMALNNPYSDSNSDELQSCRNEIIELKRMVEFLLVRCGEPNNTLSESGTMRGENEEEEEEVRRERGDDVGYEDGDDLTEATPFRPSESQILAQKKINIIHQFDVLNSPQMVLKPEGSKRNVSDSMIGDVRETPSRVQNQKVHVSTDLLTSSSSLLYLPSTELSTPLVSSSSSSSSSTTPCITSNSQPSLLLHSFPSSVSVQGSSSSSRSIYKSNEASNSNVPYVEGTPASSGINNQGAIEALGQFDLLVEQTSNVERLRACRDRQPHEQLGNLHDLEGWINKQDQKIEDGKSGGERKSYSAGEGGLERSNGFRGGGGGIDGREDVELEWLKRYHSWLLNRSKIRVQCEGSSSSGDMNSGVNYSTSLPRNDREDDFNIRGSSSSSHVDLIKSSLSFSSSADCPIPSRTATGTSGGRSSVGDEGLFDRMRMMEMSVLLQAEELATAKELFLKTNAELQLKLEMATRECEALRSTESDSRDSSWDSAFTKDKATMQQISTNPAVHSSSFSTLPSPSPSSSSFLSQQWNPPTSSGSVHRSLVPRTSPPKDVLCLQAYAKGSSTLSTPSSPWPHGEIIRAEQKPCQEGHREEGVEIKYEDRSEGGGADSREERETSRRENCDRSSDEVRGFVTLGHGHDRENKDSSRRGKEKLSSRLLLRENLITSGPGGSREGEKRDVERRREGEGESSFDYDVFPALMLTECERVEVGKQTILKVSTAGDPPNEEEYIVVADAAARTIESTMPIGGQGKAFNQGQRQEQGPDSNSGPQKVKKPQKPLWGEYVDPASGLSYYHNRSTKETKWDRPSQEEMLLLLPDHL